MCIWCIGGERARERDELLAYFDRLLCFAHRHSLVILVNDQTMRSTSPHHRVNKRLHACTLFYNLRSEFARSALNRPIGGTELCV